MTSSTKKHLEEMGLLPDEPDFGVPLELLEELVEAVADKLDNELNTRNARNDPASVLPGELIDRIREARHRRPAGEKADGRERELPSDNSEPPSQSHGGPGRMMCFAPIRPGHSPTPMHPPGGEGDAPVRSSRHPFPCSGTLRVYGCRRETSTTCIALWRNCGTCMRAEACGNAAAFRCRIFRMGLRLLIDTAAMERCGGLDRYVGEYAGEAKKRLRQAANSADLVTFMRNQAVSPENLLRLLQNGAHAYTSTGNKEQALAMSILIGEMLSISHGRP